MDNPYLGWCFEPPTFVPGVCSGGPGCQIACIFETGFFLCYDLKKRTVYTADPGFYSHKCRACFLEVLEKMYTSSLKGEQLI